MNTLIGSFQGMRKCDHADRGMGRAVGSRPVYKHPHFRITIVFNDDTVLKSEFESVHHTTLHMTFAGATEVHLFTSQALYKPKKFFAFIDHFPLLWTGEEIELSPTAVDRPMSYMIKILGNNPLYRRREQIGELEAALSGAPHATSEDIETVEATKRLTASLFSCGSFWTLISGKFTLSRTVALQIHSTARSPLWRRHSAH
jgi:hypothetical protein